MQKQASVINATQSKTNPQFDCTPRSSFPDKSVFAKSNEEKELVKKLKKQWKKQGNTPLID